MGYRESVISVNSGASGAGEGYSDFINGELHSVSLVFNGSTSANSDTTISEVGGAARTFLTIGNSATSATYYPRVQVHGPTGTALTYDGTRTVNERYDLTGRRLKIEIAQTGGALTDAVIAYVRYEQKG